MPLTTLTERLATSGNPGPSSTFNCNPSANLVAGTFQVLCYIGGGAGSNFTQVTSITDTKGNTWVLDNVFSYSSNNSSICIAHCLVSTTILTSDTITLHFVGAANVTRFVFIEEITGLIASPIDKTTTGTGTGGSASVGPTATLSQSEELAIACFQGGVSAQSFSAGSGWTTTPVGFLGTDAHAAVEYRSITGSTAGVTATGTYSRGDAVWAGAIVTYKVNVTVVSKTFGVITG